MEPINLPLMSNNIPRSDLDALIAYLQTEDPRLTHGPQVKKFEEEWSRWLGVKYSVFVNSGNSANLMTLFAIKYLFGEGEIILPPLTWVSDVGSPLMAGFDLKFVDINPKNLALNSQLVQEKITSETRAIFLTHILGFNGLDDKLLQVAKERDILLIEDVCESHGATHRGQKLGSFGDISNFSFYFAHHMSTIEGGMVCTNDDQIYQTLRMLRSHGMVREVTDPKLREQYQTNHPDLNPQFIFSHPGFNFRSTEINAVIGRSQLPRLDQNNQKRIKNCHLFYQNLDSKKYRTDFDLEGSVNYAFVLVLNEANDQLRDLVEQTLDHLKVEHRRGTSGGGNQLRQPYLKQIFGENYCQEFPQTEHIHFYGFYIGNYPDLEEVKILQLCQALNSIEI